MRCMQVHEAERAEYEQKQTASICLQEAVTSKKRKVNSLQEEMKVQELALEELKGRMTGAEGYALAVQETSEGRDDAGVLKKLRW
jgi:hypothetical protein